LEEKRKEIIENELKAKSTSLQYHHLPSAFCTSLKDKSWRPFSSFLNRMDATLEVDALSALVVLFLQAFAMENESVLLRNSPAALFTAIERPTALLVLRQMNTG
jgi:hypothetical protein